MNSVLPAAYLEAEIEGQVRRFALPTNRVVGIGRSVTNDVVVKDSLAGHNHAMVQQSSPGFFYITHLGSRNGTFVNGARIEGPAILRDSDRIVIGRLEFTFHQPTLADCAATEKPDAAPPTAAR